MYFFKNDSSMFEKSPIECYKLKIVSGYYVILLILSFVFNLILLFTFWKFKSSYKTNNLFMVTITILNAIGCVLELPIVIVSNYLCRWVFEIEGCVFSGLVMYFVGCTSCYLLSALSLENYLTVKYATETSINITNNSISNRTKKMILFGCIFLGAFWSFMPFAGWSYYTFEKSLTSCCVEWAERSFNVTSYNITIFIFVFIIPMFSIIYLNTRVTLMVRRWTSIFTTLNQQTILAKRIIFQRNITIRNLIIVVCFIISWSPYAIVSMYCAFIDPDGISPLKSLLPSILAKSSFLWTPVIFIIFDKRIRLRFIFRNKRDQNGRDQNGST